MDTGSDEIPLGGGNVSTGVVRVGDTVRRSPGLHHESVHRFLQHLERAGFPQAPRFLGFDRQGREILSFLDGTAAFPDDLWSNDGAVVASAKMLRALHDASRDFDDWAPGRWAYAYPDARRHEVICHNDFAPYNMIFAAGLPVGIVDFDLAGPGPRLRDIAYLAYWMTPLSFASPDLAGLTTAQGAAGYPRLRLLCATYGIACSGAVPAMVSEVLHHMGDRAAVAAMVGGAAAARLEQGGHFAHWRREAQAFDAHADELAACL